MVPYREGDGTQISGLDVHKHNDNDNNNYITSYICVDIFKSPLEKASGGACNVSVSGG